MVRILAAGDLHDSKATAERLAKKALDEKVELIILTGDIHGYTHGNEKILEPLIKTKKKILFVPGNCENTEEYQRLKESAQRITFPPSPS